MNPERTLSTFFELIAIESPSRHEAAMAARCQQELEDLGFTVRFDNSGAETGSEVGNLIARLEGTAPGMLALSAHMDTVVPCEGIEPVIRDGVICSAGDTILSADDKAGVTAIFEGVRCVLESGNPYPTIYVLLSTCEELSLLGSGALDSTELPQGIACYVFDADGHPGTIIAEAPAHYTLRATFHGTSAHAGVEPEKGASAVSMACAAIAAMPLGRLDEYTTANMGLIKGGREVNIVADECWISGECRSVFKDRVDAQQARMTEACKKAAADFGGTVDINWRIDYEAIRYTQDDPLVKGIYAACERAGLEPVFSRSGGGADANIFASRGARAITLGTGMTNFHTTQEYISVKDLEDSAKLVEALIAQHVEA